MDILQGVHYFYTSNGQQVGPVEGTELVRMAYQGQVMPTDQVWTEGMPEWQSASNFPQIASALQSAAQAALQQPVAEDAPVVVKQPGLARPGVILMPREEGVPERYRKRVSFSAWVWTFVLACGVLLAGAFFDESPFGKKMLNGNEEIFQIAILCLFGGLMIGHIYLSWVNLYRAWSHIQELGTARTTPGRAVGLMFVPFFNIYWLFQAYYGWAEDYNRYIERMGADHVRPASSGLMLASCILSLLSIPFLWPFSFYMMCRCTNDISDLPAPEDLGIELA